MPPIVLATANARYAHTALGLRTLLANLGPWQPHATLCEFTLNDRPADIVEALLGQAPRLVGLGVYVWNVGLLAEVVELLRLVAPEVRLVLGGPEVGHDGADPAFAAAADAVVGGEGERVLPDLCTALLGPPPGIDAEPPAAAAADPAGSAALAPEAAPTPRRIVAPPPDLTTLALPYAFYGARDLAERVVYVETTRGCPGGCEFCLAGRDRRVRRFPRPAILAALAELWQRGARRFKFVDRALDLAPAAALLDFFLARPDPGLHLHFEWTPGRLPAPLLARLARFPAGAVQLEAGVQTFDRVVARRIGRRQDPDRVADNLRRVLTTTGVQVHADLIVGLPGEGLTGLAAGFDRLVALGVHEIQVGVLKRLRGTPLGRHDAAFGMRYRPVAPYDVLETAALDFATVQRLKRLARGVDLVFNSGRFCETTRFFRNAASPFARFLALADALHARCGALTGLSIERLARELFAFLAAQAEPPAAVAAALTADFARLGQRAPHLAPAEPAAPASAAPPAAGLPPRQRRRLAAAPRAAGR